MPLAIRRVPIAIRRIPKILTSLSLVALLYIASLTRYQNLFHLIIGNYTSDLNFKGPVAHNETSTSDASNVSRDGGDASTCPVGSKPVEKLYPSRIYEAWRYLYQKLFMRALVGGSNSAITLLSFTTNMTLITIY